MWAPRQGSCTWMLPFLNLWMAPQHLALFCRTWKWCCRKTSASKVDSSVSSISPIGVEMIAPLSWKISQRKKITNSNQKSELSSRQDSTNLSVIQVMKEQLRIIITIRNLWYSILHCYIHFLVISPKAATSYMDDLYVHCIQILTSGTHQ